MAQISKDNVTEDSIYTSSNMPVKIPMNPCLIIPNLPGRKLQPIVIIRRRTDPKHCVPLLLEIFYSSVDPTNRAPANEVDEK